MHAQPVLSCGDSGATKDSLNPLLMLWRWPCWEMGRAVSSKLPVPGRVVVVNRNEREREKKKDFSLYRIKNSGSKHTLHLLGLQRDCNV